ncbi:MAG: hypothetical protein KAI66_01480 [Lentisphaeria bacterium]|nr:hypothetical protein [Lentisphaeria bacterium]
MAQVRLPTFERRHTPTHGEFLHPAEDRDLIDFFAFRNDRMADAMIRIAGIVKGASSLKRPVLFFYGYTFEINNGLIEGGHARWSRLLACDDIDLFCAPTAYFGRWPGHAGYFHAPVDSVALHGKMWFNEDDVRTYLIPGAKGRWTPRDLKQNIDNYERNFAHLFVRRMGCWYMDLLGRGWLNDPELWRGIGQLNVFWEKHKDDPVTFAPDIAIIADERSPYFMPHVRNNRGPSVNGPLLGQLRGKLGGVGAPVGYYLLPDFLADRIDAKVYVFLNAFAVTGAERKRFHEILKRRGATAVWLYGPGYVDPERKVLGTEGISALTGMATAQLAHPVPDTLRPVGGMTQLTGPGSETFGTGYSTIKSQWGILPGDSVTPLAVYETEPGTIGAAMTKRLGFTSIHIAGLSVSTELMRGIARQAGVWIYCDSGDAIVADDRFLMIHAASDGLKTIRLPVPRTVRDCLTDEVLVQGDVLKIKMKATETRLLRFE